MSQKSSSLPLFTQVHVGGPLAPVSSISTTEQTSEITSVLREMLSAMDRQNELLEELVTNTTEHRRQREAELKRWRRENPKLARNCRSAADSLGRIHAEFLDSLTREIDEHAEELQDGEFMLQEFVDRFGPRLAHLTGIMHLLSQLSPPPPDERTESA